MVETSTIIAVIVAFLVGAGGAVAVIWAAKINLNPAPAPLSADEKAKAQEILKNLDLIQAEVEKTEDEEKKKELEQTLSKLRAEQAGTGPSIIPRKDHENLEEMWKYLQQNDIWEERRGSVDNFFN